MELFLQALTTCAASVLATAWAVVYLPAHGPGSVAITSVIGGTLGALFGAAANRLTR